MGPRELAPPCSGQDEDECGPQLSLRVPRGHSFFARTLSRIPSEFSSGTHRSVVYRIPTPEHNETIFARVALSLVFQNLTLVVILANAAWIGADTEWNHSRLFRDDSLPLEPESVYVELLFCVFFTLELLVRFLAYAKKLSCLRDSWFVFDFTLLVFMIIENIVGVVAAAEGGNLASRVGDIAIFKLLRLLRLTRLARLMRFFPELMTLVKGMVRATESVFFVLFFLTMIVFGTSIIFTTQVGKPPPARPPPTPDGEDPTALDMFGDMGSSMMTLFTNGVLGDNLHQTLIAIKDESLILAWVFIAFVIISGITLLNMLIGVLCQVVQATSEGEHQKRKANRMKDIFCKAFQVADISKDGFIQEQEWTAIEQDPEVRRKLLRLGVPEEELDMRLGQFRAKVFWDRPARELTANIDMACTASCSTDGSSSSSSSSHWNLPSSGKPFELDFQSFVEQVSNLQWDRKASVLDVESFRCHFDTETKVTKKKLDDVERIVREVLKKRGLAADGRKHGAPDKSASNPSKPAMLASSPPPAPPVAEPPLLKPLSKTPSAYPSSLQPAARQPQPTPPPRMVRSGSITLPPLPEAPTLPPLPEGSMQPLALPQHAAVPPSLEWQPGVPRQPEPEPTPCRAADGQAARGAAEAPRFANPWAPGSKAAWTDLPRGEVSASRDRLAAVPTEVLFAAIKTRALRQRRETIA